MSVRVIPRLEIKGPNLVKGIHLEGLRVLGRPEAFARAYSEEGADELLYMDVVASLYGRNSLLDIVRRTASEIFIPLTVGGGLRSVDDIRAVLRAGADKVALNTAAIAKPDLIREASRLFGSSTIVISIEAIRQPDGSYQAYTDSGREATGVDVFDWAVQAAEAGAGEILLCSVDQEGTGRGFDLGLTRRVSESVRIPVIACGGAGTPAHIRDVVENGKADAVALGSVLHYDLAPRLPVDERTPGEGNTEYLRSKRVFSRVQPISIARVKRDLIDAKIPCRPPSEVVPSA